MNYEEEIKKLKRLNMRMYMTMADIINILNERETNILMKNLQNIKNEIDFNDNDINDIRSKIDYLDSEFKKINDKLNYELFNSVNYLMKKQIEREVESDTEIFTYESSDKECNNGGYEECNNSDCSECQKDKYY